MGRYLDIARRTAMRRPEETEPLASYYQAADLRQKTRRATTWDELDGVTREAQAAFDAGEATGDEVESLAGYVGGEVLADLLARRPVVRVRSRLLGEVVVWVADAAEVPDDISEVVYRESELRRMVGRPAAEVRAIHEAKRSFDGELAE